MSTASTSASTLAVLQIVIAAVFPLLIFISPVRTILRLYMEVRDIT
jgi:hypothetical protein